MIAQTGAGVFIWEAAPSAQSRERITALGLTDVVFPPLANRPDDGGFVDQMKASLESLELVLR